MAHTDRPLLFRSSIALLIALAVHSVPFFLFHPGDADRYLIPWYEHIIQTGRVRAFSQPFSNYTPAYLYLLSLFSLLHGILEPWSAIKLLSWVGAGWMVYAIGRLLRDVEVEFASTAALAVLLLPSIILNVSMFGQADTFWVAPCILAMTAALGGRLAAVAFWSGIAFSFKAQAVFLAPFCLYLYLTRATPWWCWFIPPFVYCAVMLPAWLAGWPASNLLTVYVRQVEWQPELGGRFISNGASWWTIYGQFFPTAALKTFWIGYISAVGGLIGYLLFVSNRCTSPRAMIAAAALGSAGLPFLLPGMHERFFILADVLTYCLAVADPQRKTIAAAVLMQFASSIPGYGWAFGLVLLKLPACFFGLGALLMLIDYLRDPRDRQSVGLAPRNSNPGQI